MNYEGVSKSSRTGRLERELQMVQLYATRCSCIAILWVSLVSFAAITLCVASQRVFIVVRVFRLQVKWLIWNKAFTRNFASNAGQCFGNAWNAQNSFRWQCHGEDANFWGVLSPFKRRETFRSKILSVQLVPQQAAQTKAWRMFAKSSTKTDESPLRRLLAG
jgi:hypothetical protein